MREQSASPLKERVSLINKNEDENDFFLRTVSFYLFA